MAEVEEKEEMKKFQTQDDVRLMASLAEILKDSDRLDRVKKMLDDQKKTVTSIADLKAKAQEME